MSNPKAIVLFSGGIDSTVCVAQALELGFDIYPMSFYYGQKHSQEMNSQDMILSYYKEFCKKRYAEKGKSGKIAQTHSIHLDETLFATFRSSLVNDNMEVPTNRPMEAISEGIPSTYIPGRNTIFLAHAFALSECIHAQHIVIGANALDHTGYPDCRPEYFKAWNLLITSAQTGPGTSIVTPLLHLSKAEIIRRGTKMQAPLHLTSSCYKANHKTHGKACGICDSCIIRKKGFEEAGVIDPTEYRHEYMS